MPGFLILQIYKNCVCLHGIVVSNYFQTAPLKIGSQLWFATVINGIAMESP